METKTIFASTIEAKFLNVDLWKKIMDLDLTLIRDRMIIKYSWDEHRTDMAIREYRQYLYMCQLVKSPIAPTVDGDEIWHQHILHTNKYCLDCMKIFGRFLHHLPTPSKHKVLAMTNGNCQSPCCNHQDCCNDNPSLKSRASVTAEGELLHADCDGDGPIADSCVNLGGSDIYCGGTTNDSFSPKAINYDNPDVQQMTKPLLFKDIVGLFFKD